MTNLLQSKMSFSPQKHMPELLKFYTFSWTLLKIIFKLLEPNLVRMCIHFHKKLPYIYLWLMGLSKYFQLKAI